jgi:hypothetical protein
MHLVNLEKAKMVILSYVFGILGILVSFIIYQQKTRGGLLVSKLIGDAIWFVHYVLIGAYTGAAISIIAIVRELVFMHREKKWANSPLWLVLFLALSALSGVITWKNLYSIFPCVASALAVISFWIGKPRLSRILAYPITISMLTYNVASLAYLAIANEALSLVSAVIGNIRYDFAKQTKDTDSCDRAAENTEADASAALKL